MEGSKLKKIRWLQNSAVSNIDAVQKRDVFEKQLLIKIIKNMLTIEKYHNK